MFLKNRRGFAVAATLALLTSGLTPGDCLAGTEGRDGTAARAASAYDNGQWEEALEHYTRLAQEFPKDTEVFFRLGNLHARLGRLREAAENYEKVLANNPRHARSRHNLGVVRVRQAIVALSQAQLDSDAAREAEPPPRRLLEHLEYALGGQRDASPPPAPEPGEPQACPETSPSANTSVAYSAARVNLRSGPGKRFAKVAVLPAGTALTVRARQEGYAQADTAAGQTGWLPLYLLRMGAAPVEAE